MIDLTLEETMTLKLFDLLRMHEPTFDPLQSKVHMAKWNKIDDPMDVWLAGDFESWQCWQNKRNFRRPLVVSLIRDTPWTKRWMFAGLFSCKGCTPEISEGRVHYTYDLVRIESAAELEGRLFVSSPYKERQTYPYGETVAGELKVIELLPERRSVGQFPGFKKVYITKNELDILLRNRSQSWMTALSSVKGIYLITDSKSGRLYVGKAGGENGIWGRWCQYASTGHGFNRALVKELGEVASDRQNDLRFSILEIADLQSGPGEIDQREVHWKGILMSRLTGYNMN